MTQPCATVTSARVLAGYRVELTFADGAGGIMDLAPRIVGRGGLLGALEDPQLFQRMTLNSELGTIVWPNGADFCPDLLHAWATGQPVSPPESHAVPS
jgi:hypothetical protein